MFIILQKINIVNKIKDNRKPPPRQPHGQPRGGGLYYLTPSSGTFRNTPNKLVNAHNSPNNQEHTKHPKSISCKLRIALKHPKQLIDFTINKSSIRHRSEHLRQPLTAGPFPVCYSSGHRQAHTSPTRGSVRPTGDQPSTPGKPTIKGKPAEPVVSEALS